MLLLLYQDIIVLIKLTDINVLQSDEWRKQRNKFLSGVSFP